MGLLSSLGLGREELEKLETFAELVTDLAAPRGLIGFRARDIEREIIRSLALLKVLGDAESFIDIGSGAGFPGIPLAVALGTAILIEPRRRAVAFLEKVARELSLSVRIEPQTAQLAARSDLRESADAVVARAVAPPAAAIQLCAPFCRVGGLVVLTAEAESESPEIAPSLLGELGLGPPATTTLTTLAGPIAISQRVHIMSKIDLTSPSYPRRGHAPRKTKA